MSEQMCEAVRELERARSHSVKEHQIRAELDSRAGVFLCSSG